ncbi:MAG: hypothetical protein BWY76_00162 [bacterium ADurb.Bin429]|nr:MAG: hypothetical protein BWY76_00162 [bacterium ADurb.Bin429]
MGEQVYTLKLKRDMPIFLELAETAGHRADKVAELCMNDENGIVDPQNLQCTSAGKLTATVPTPIAFARKPYLFLYSKIYPQQNTPETYRVECSFQAPGEFTLHDAHDKEIPSKKIILSEKFTDYTRISLRINIILV